jgi:aarF domain-containing kinase
MASRVRVLLSTLGKAAVVSGVGVGAFVKYKIEQDDGAKRSYTFWKSIFPIYLHYRYYQLLNRDLKWMPDEEAAANYERLHVLYTDRVRELTYSMRGFYLKHAQLMSTMDHFVPPAYMKWVKDTQDKVPSEFQGSEAREYCAKLLREEQGLDFYEIFSEWDDNPIGVASIGQVHRARLKLNNQLVAVKLLMPGMEPKFRADIRTIKSFCELAMPQHVSSFDEIEKQFCTGN